jgi:hypothetical protein
VGTLPQGIALRDAKVKRETAATKKDWEQANLWADQVWQYQVKAADIGLRAKTFVEQMRRPLTPSLAHAAAEESNPADFALHRNGDHHEVP